MNIKVHLATAVCFCLVAIFTAGTAIAQDEDTLVTDRPDLTESANTVGHLRFQIETGFGWERFEEGDIKENNYFMPTLLRFGLGDNFELRLETAAISRANISAPGFDEEFTGFSPISLGVKYNFFEGEDYGDATLALLASVEVPSGTDEFETDEYAYTAKLLASWDFDDTFSLGVNGGFEKQTDGTGEDFVSLVGTAALGIGLTEQWGVFVEVAIDSAESTDGEALWLFDTGLTYLANPNLQFDMAAGTGLSGEEAPDFFMTAGLSARF